MVSPSERDTLIDELVGQYRKQLQEQLPQGNQTLDQIEDIAGRLGETVSQEVQRRLANQQTKSPRPKRLDCGCGAAARYKGRQPRTLVTRHGPLRVYRACYYCGHCHKTLVPADTLLGLDAGCTSTQVHLWIGWLCALLPFAQAATTLEMLTSVGLSAATLERVSLALGTSLREEQQQQAQDHRHQRLPEPEGKRMRRLYIGMDDLFVPLRDPWKKDRSQGDLACRFGECKLGRDARVGVCDYTATMQSVETFEPLVATLAHQHGHHQAHEVVVLGDGAAWIGQVATRQFPGAVQIVDYYHACDHLATYAQARFGKESQSGNLWLKQRAGAETALPITLTSEAKELVRSLVTHLEGWSVGQGRLRRRLRRAMQQGVTRTAYDRRSEDALSPEAFALLESAAYEANRIYGALAAEGSPTNATWPV